MRQMMPLAAANDGSAGPESVKEDGPRGASQAVVDLVHLARQTLGNAELEREILQLFITQLRSVEDRLTGADGRDIGFLIHGLKGSARSVGAFPLADACAAWEEAPGAEARGVVLDTVRVTRLFVDHLIG